MAFTVRTGAFASGTTTLTCPVPTAGNAPVSGDLMLIQVESSNSTTAVGTPTTPTGWTKLSENSGNVGATGVTTHTIFGKIADASEADVTVTGFLDHGLAQMIVISGHGVNDITVDVIIGANATGATTSGANSQAITVLAGSAVFIMVGVTTDAISSASFSAWTNANLSAPAEIIDNGISTGAGGAIGCAWGTCAGTTSGTSTWTSSSAARFDSIHLGVPPGPTNAELSATDPNYNGLGRVSAFLDDEDAEAYDYYAQPRDSSVEAFLAGGAAPSDDSYIAQLSVLDDGIVSQTGDVDEEHYNWYGQKLDGTVETFIAGPPAAGGPSDAELVAADPNYNGLGRVSGFNEDVDEEAYDYYTAARPALDVDGLSVFRAVATYSDLVLRDGALGYWKLDESAGPTAVDSSGRGYNGTYQGTPTGFSYPSLIDGGASAVNFDGVDDYINVPTVPDLLNLTAEFTIEAWVNVPTSETLLATIIAPQYDGARVPFALGTFDGSNHSLKPSIAFYNGAWRVAQSATPIDKGVVHHFVGTWDGTSLRIYVDGVLAQTNVPGSAPTSGSTQFVGIATRWDNAGDGQKVKGPLDEVAVYGGTLSAAQIAEHYAVGISGRLAAAPYSILEPTTDVEHDDDDYWTADATLDVSAFVAGPPVVADDGYVATIDVLDDGWTIDDYPDQQPAEMVDGAEAVLGFLTVEDEIANAAQLDAAAGQDDDQLWILTDPTDIAPFVEQAEAITGFLQPDVEITIAAQPSRGEDTATDFPDRIDDTDEQAVEPVHVQLEEYVAGSTPAEDPLYAAQLYAEFDVELLWPDDEPISGPVQPWVEQAEAVVGFLTVEDAIAAAAQLDPSVGQDDDQTWLAGDPTDVAPFIDGAEAILGFLTIEDAIAEAAQLPRDIGWFSEDFEQANDPTDIRSFTEQGEGFVAGPPLFADDGYIATVDVFDHSDEPAPDDAFDFYATTQEGTEWSIGFLAPDVEIAIGAQPIRGEDTGLDNPDWDYTNDQPYVEQTEAVVGFLSPDAEIAEAAQLDRSVGQDDDQAWIVTDPTDVWPFTDQAEAVIAGPPTSDDFVALLAPHVESVAVDFPERIDDTEEQSVETVQIQPEENVAGSTAADDPLYLAQTYFDPTGWAEADYYPEPFTELDQGASASTVDVAFFRATRRLVYWLDASAFDPANSTDASLWTASTGAPTYNPATGEWTMSLGDQIKSPLIAVPYQDWTIQADFFTSTVSNQFSPTGGMIWGTEYFAADGTTLAPNKDNYLGNGNAQAVPLSTYTTVGWGYDAGNQVVYVRWNITAEGFYANAGTNTLKVKNIRVKAPSVGAPPSSGAAIATWRDQSEFGADATQATGGQQPVYRAGAFNGNAAVDFDGVDDQMLSTPVIGSLDDVTVFAVFARQNDATIRSPFAMTPATNFRLQLLSGQTGVDAVGALIGTGTSFFTELASPATVLGVEMATIVSSNAGTDAVYVFNQLRSQNSGVANIIAPTGSWYVGSRAGANFHQGLVCEIRVFNWAMSPAERQAQEAELIAKWFDVSDYEAAFQLDDGYDHHGFVPDPTEDFYATGLVEQAEAVTGFLVVEDAIAGAAQLPMDVGWFPDAYAVAEDPTDAAPFTEQAEAVIAGPPVTTDEYVATTALVPDHSDQPAPDDAWDGWAYPVEASEWFIGFTAPDAEIADAAQDHTAGQDDDQLWTLLDPTDAAPFVDGIEYLTGFLVPADEIAQTAQPHYGDWQDWRETEQTDDYANDSTIGVEDTTNAPDAFDLTIATQPDLSIGQDWHLWPDWDYTDDQPYASELDVSPLTFPADPDEVTQAVQPTAIGQDDDALWTLTDPTDIAPFTEQAEGFIAGPPDAFDTTIATQPDPSMGQDTDLLNPPDLSQLDTGYVEQAEAYVAGPPAFAPDAEAIASQPAETGIDVEGRWPEWDGTDATPFLDGAEWFIGFTVPDVEITIAAQPSRAEDAAVDNPDRIEWTEETDPATTLDLSPLVRPDDPIEVTLATQLDASVGQDDDQWWTLLDPTDVTPFIDEQEQLTAGSTPADDPLYAAQAWPDVSTTEYAPEETTDYANDSALDLSPLTFPPDAFDLTIATQLDPSVGQDDDQGWIAADPTDIWPFTDQLEAFEEIVLPDEGIAATQDYSDAQYEPEALWAPESLSDGSTEFIASDIEQALLPAATALCEPAAEPEDEAWPIYLALPDQSGEFAATQLDIALVAALDVPAALVDEAEPWHPEVALADGAEQLAVAAEIAVTVAAQPTFDAYDWTTFEQPVADLSTIERRPIVARPSAQPEIIGIPALADPGVALVALKDAGADLVALAESEGYAMGPYGAPAPDHVSALEGEVEQIDALSDPDVDVT